MTERHTALRMLLLVATLSVAVAADAQPTVLHEYFAPDPNEDVAFAATTLDGDLPAAIQTPSGVATAPDPKRPPADDRVYNGATADDGPDSTYEADRDTRRPDVENYDDPFSPSTAPFKRLRAYDAVSDDDRYTLRVARTGLRAVPVGGKVEGGDEPFYADLSVDLLPGQPVRIPSVGPGQRVLKLHVNPDADVSLLADGAENLFVQGVERKRVRLVMEIAIARAAFGSELADVSWEDLAEWVHPLPDRHRASAAEVAAHIGVTAEQRPSEVVARLVEYFRAFRSSDELPSDSADIYRDLALSQKGVCRHRSFAFLVTALHLGIPARMVVNEAHAWVEVYDTKLWHRIDLGGAALDLSMNDDSSRPPYAPPPDPYEWPADAEQGSGQGLADRVREEAEAADPSATDPTKSSPTDGAPSDAGGTNDPSDPNAPPLPPPTPADPARPPSELEVGTVDKDVLRGKAVRVKGQVMSDGRPCAHIRVDVMLEGELRPRGVVVGSVSTDDEGRYDGAVVVPRDVTPGDYRMFVVTSGDARCGPGRSQ